MNIKQNQSIALLVGAGSVENAWLPITRALRPAHFTKELSTEGANNDLARLVYLGRFFSTQSDKESLLIHKEISKNKRQRICEEIKLAQENNEIFARDQFHEILRHIILSNCKRLMVASTNWDTVIEDAINNTPAIKILFGKIIAAHLHGVYLDSNILYLPTEVIREPYRTTEEENVFGSMGVSFMQHLADAEIIIIYGLSISPLDAELNQILGTAIHNNKNLHAIKIIDLNPERVAEKIQLLLQYPTNIVVEGYAPTDLDKSIIYTA